MDIMKKRRSLLTHTQVIALSFLLVILAGAFLLTLPVSSASGEWTPFFPALFTATSATCVTGLVVFDTYLYWSFFGQIVILIMIQIGGLGFMTVISAFFIVMKKKLSLHERSLLMQSTGALQLGGMIKLIRKILIYTFFFEFLGAVLLSVRFIPEFGVKAGIWSSIFHSVSAFCNAGFDLMGVHGAFASLTAYAADPLVTLTIGGLITVGGLGFIVMADLVRKRFRFRSLELHSKIVIVTTLSLTLAGWFFFYFLERSHSLSELSPGARALASLFLAITPRTAGFNTVDLTAMSESGAFLTSVYMLIGGSPGSTAGGIKSTTFAVLVLSVIAFSSKRTSITVFKRRIDDNTVKRATAITSVYIAATVLAVLLICALEPYSLREVLFEVCSALGTVGLTMGITPDLCWLSQLVLILLMYAGRIGGLSLMLIVGERLRAPATERPTENILVG